MSTPSPHLFPAEILPPPSPPTPETRTARRGSISASFSFGPHHLVNSLANPADNAALDPNRSILPPSPFRLTPRQQRRRLRKSQKRRQPHPLATDFQDSDDADDDEEGEEGDEEGEGEEGYEWGMVDRMRLWRHDALMQHLYETAAFWGDKILSWTNDPNDAFWLAQTYFMTHQYSRAERLLTRPFPMTPPKPVPKFKSPSPLLTNGHAHHGPSMQANSYYKGKGRACERLPMGPGGMIEIPEELIDGVSRLVDMSVACRYLAAQCLVRQGNWSEATEMLGEANPFRETRRAGADVANSDGGIKVEASMCHLRGLLMLKLNRGEIAKQCFMEALALDVKCYDAFEQLVSGEMMTAEEEWHFIQSIAYPSQLSHSRRFEPESDTQPAEPPETPLPETQDAEFIRLIYTARLRKYHHVEEHQTARTKLVEEYGLGDNPDVLFSFADALYAGFRWADCFAITERIVSLVTIHTPTMPLHIACMYHLSHLHSKLFILAHEMVDREPENPVSWYAVGVWYLAGGKWGLARQYFSKTSLMDPRFGPAWVAFAHTFALEGEHDHAVTAYSTCARMFTGSHLPLMFVGMEHITLSNYALADEALNAAYSMCRTDPLLVNERGVMAYNHGDFEKAATMFEQATELAKITQSSQKSWATVYLNLGTCYRKLGRLPEAKTSYRKVLEIDPQNSLALGFLGITYHLLEETDEAIVKYHEALSIDPINGHIIELLNLALESNMYLGASLPKAFPGGDKAFEKTMQMLKARAEAAATQKSKTADKGKGKAKDEAPAVAMVGGDSDMSMG